MENVSNSAQQDLCQMVLNVCVHLVFFMKMSAFQPALKDIMPRIENVHPANTHARHAPEVEIVV